MGEVVIAYLPTQVNSNTLLAIRQEGIRSLLPFVLWK